MGTAISWQLIGCWIVFLGTVNVIRVSEAATEKHGVQTQHTYHHDDVKYPPTFIIKDSESHTNNRVAQMAKSLFEQMHAKVNPLGRLIVGFVGKASYGGEGVIRFDPEHNEHNGSSIKIKEFLGVGNVWPLEMTKICIILFEGSAQIKDIEYTIHVLLENDAVVSVENDYKVIRDSGSDPLYREEIVEIDPFTEPWRHYSNASDSLLIPNDPRFRQQISLFDPKAYLRGTYPMDIRAVQAWDILLQDSYREPVVIGVVDDDFYLEHEDLKESFWVNENEIPGDRIDNDGNGCIDDIHGCNFGKLMPDGSFYADVPHGTHVTGIIGAQTNNGLGIAGAFPGVKMVVVGSYGLGSDVHRSLEYLLKLGVRISSNSYGSMRSTPGAIHAIKEAGKHGHLFVRSAGNQGIDLDNPPKDVNVEDLAPDMSNVISVANLGMGQSGTLDEKSNWSATTVHLAAPGEMIWSTVPYDPTSDSYYNAKYDQMSGTSQSTPLVTATAGMILSLYPCATPEDLKEIILKYVTKLDSLKGYVITGGLLNAEKALRGAEKHFEGRPCNRNRG